MSSKDTGEGSPSRTEAIEEAAGEWLERVALGALSAEDRAAFEAWKGASLANRIAYVRLESTWNRTERLAALRRPMIDKSAIERRTRRWHGLKHAAVFVTLALLGAGAMFGAQPTNDLSYATEVGNREIISLTDGSHIELNTNSSIRVRLSHNRREVFLDKGEAFFDVAHDVTRPFTVMAFGHRIVDIGTKFSVRQSSRDVEVSLIEGRVRLDPSSPHSIMLSPGDIAIATSTDISVRKASRQLLTDQMGWRRGVIVFDNTSLADAIQEVNRYNHTKLVANDPSVSRLTISGTFPADNFQIVLEAARDVYGLHVRSRGDEILISR